MHLEFLYMKAMEMRDVRDKIHEVGKLVVHKLVRLDDFSMDIVDSAYPDPKDTLHSEVLRPRFRIHLHYTLEGRIEEILLV